MATKMRPPPPPKPKSPAKSAVAAAAASHNGNGLTTTQNNTAPTNGDTIHNHHLQQNHLHDNTHNNDNAISIDNENNHQKLTNNITSSTPPSLDHESVVMTPRGKTANSTVILIERKLIERIGERQHVAGGQHTGIIINKDALGERRSDHEQPQLSLEFRVFLISAQTQAHSQESRALRFWFRDWLADGDRQAQVAQEFFRELVAPKEFPRGTFGPMNDG